MGEGETNKKKQVYFEDTKTSLHKLNFNNRHICHCYCKNDQSLIRITWNLGAHQNLPESCPSTMEERRKQNALVMQVLKDAAETSENLSRGSWPTRK